MTQWLIEGGNDKEESGKTERCKTLQIVEPQRGLKLIGKRKFKLLI